MSSVAAGLRALGHGKLILLLALTSALLGIWAAAPLGPALAQDVGGTLAGDHFVRNHPTFAPSDLSDFFLQDKAALAGVRGAARVSAALGVLLQAFLAGGIVVVLGRGPFSFGQFFEPARRNFWHNVKCLLLFLLLIASAGGIVLGGAFAISKKLFETAPPDSSAHAAWDWSVRIVALLLFGALSLLYDFARAARRYAPRIGAWRAYGLARRALRGAWARAIGLFLFWLLVGGAAWFGTFAAAWTMKAVSPLAIVVLFLVQFSALWVRSAARVAAWGSYLDFLDRRAPRALGAVVATVAPPGAGALAVPLS